MKGHAIINQDGNKKKYQNMIGRASSGDVRSVCLGGCHSSFTVVIRHSNRSILFHEFAKAEFVALAESLQSDS